MKDKSQFLAILLSVVICFIAVFAITYAATTVGNNITVGGTIAINGSAHSTELSVIGTASISEDLWASGSFQFAGGESTATVSYSRLGSGTTGHSLSNADDLLITGSIEVDGTVYFDGDLAIKGSAAPSTELSVLGTASVSEDLWASGSFQFGGGESTATVSYSRLGGTATGHGLSNANDLVINGSLEVDGTVWFDGAASLSSNGLILDDGATLTTGVASPSAACVIGSLFIDTVLGRISICDGDGNWSPITIQ